MKHSLLMRAVAGSVILGSAALGLVASSLPAGATSPSVMAQGWTPREAPYNGGYTYYWPLAKGTSVTMECWTTGPYVDGTGKWFRIISNVYPFQRDGYVPANAVARQASVGRC